MIVKINTLSTLSINKVCLVTKYIAYKDVLDRIYLNEACIMNIKGL